MTQEDKDLLLKDLCARLPYGVKCNATLKQIDGSLKSIFGIFKGYNGWATIGNNLVDIKTVRPYLRPMSSMTEEEKKDILQSLNIHGDIDNEGNLLLGVECDIITLKVCKKYLGELNKRMFDVCHMIEKGLAFEAEEGMYNN